MKELYNKKGTIAYILNQNINELFTLINDGKIAEARKLALDLINSADISDKQAVATANHVFTTSKDNLFLSSLSAYITGMKVS